MPITTQERTSNPIDTQLSDVPNAFGRIVADRLPDILARQKANGAIELNAKAPPVYPQQAIFPLAFCWAGLDPDKRWKGDAKVADSIRRLGDYLLSWYDDTGSVSFDSYGYQVNGVDQRLTYAWTEALDLLRTHGGDFKFDAWGDKIARASQSLIDTKLKKLQGLRRFVVRIMGTSTNHVMLYATTVYRAGMVLGRKDFCDAALPIARAIAADMHPDGYWDEHSDLQRSGGPTPAYNYLTFGGVGLMARWTGEDVFNKAVETSARFHSNFCYPDAVFLDVIDERVRCDLSPRRWNAHYDAPRVWGLYAMSGTPEGRASAALHMAGWMRGMPDGMPVNPETLARHVENFMHWQSGPIGQPPTSRRDHRATLTLPGGIFRSGAWCMGLSTIRAVTAEDDAYRPNPFALERQKLFSVWHEKTGLIIDGSNSKRQPDNSTFAAKPDQAHDYFPCGGTIGQADGEFFANAAYKTFFASVRMKPMDDRTLRIVLSVDPAATQGPFTAAFTLRMLDKQIATAKGAALALSSETFEMTAEQLGGGFSFGAVTITGPRGFKLNWPMSPFNSYAADNKPAPEASVPRVSVELTPSAPSAEFTLTIR